MNNNNKVKRVIKYSTSWCPPCKAYAPVFQKVSEMNEFSDLEFEAIQIDDGEDHSIDVEKYNIRSVPTTILLDENNDVIYKIMGSMPGKDLVELINKALEDRDEENTEES